MEDRFLQLENEYRRLRDLLKTKRITTQQFDAELEKLVIQDAYGRYWRLERNSGHWIFYDGQSWQEANPYPAGKTPKVPRKRRLGWLSILGIGCLVTVLLLAVVGLGGYFAYTKGLITIDSVLNLVGLGPAEVELDNFLDGTAHIHITQLVSQEQSSFVSFREISSFDVQIEQFPEPGRYLVEFGTESLAADLGSCTLRVKGGDRYQFTLMPEMIIINLASKPSKNGADFIINTSSFCVE